MPVIIAATDFSSVAENAVRYACKMALAHNASVNIVHSYIIPVVFNDNPMPVMPIEEGKQIAENTMNTFVESLRSLYPGLVINSYVAYGDITDTLYDYAQTQNPWLIVVGNSSSENDNFWMGSNLITTLKKLQYTVMAVPPEAKYEGVHKIAFACDFRTMPGHSPAKELVNLVGITKASLHVINIDHDNKELAKGFLENTGPFHELLGAAKPEYHYIENEDFSEGIRQFVESNKIDWLVEIPHEHSLLDSILHKSHTKAMVRLAHIPLIALHDK